MQFSELKWDAAGLVTVVVQDQATGEIRMLAHANQAALDATLATGQAHFYSRSRGQQWMKGESSGNTIAVSEVWADCDADAVLYLAAPAGPSCHTGRDTCFFRRVTPEGIEDSAEQHGQPTLMALEGALAQRAASTADKSYTKSLLVKGASKAADVLYHLMVGLLFRKVPLKRVQEVLGARFGVSGHVEKAARSKP